LLPERPVKLGSLCPFQVTATVPAKICRRLSSPSPSWLPFSVSSFWSAPSRLEGATKTVAGSGAIEQLTAGRLASEKHGGNCTLILASRWFSQPKLRMTQAHAPKAGSRPIHSRARADRSLPVEAFAASSESILYFTSPLL
jgi:hypothetical protein